MIRVPDVREDIANWREAGYSVELMVNAGEMVIDGRGSGLTRTTGQHDRHDIGFIRMSVLRKIPYEKPCIGREYFAYPRK